MARSFAQLQRVPKCSGAGQVEGLDGIAGVRLGSLLVQGGSWGFHQTGAGTNPSTSIAGTVSGWGSTRQHRGSGGGGGGGGGRAPAPREAATARVIAPWHNL